MAAAGEGVTGLLLAAGLSRRFGDDDKLLAPLDGVPLVLHAARTMAGLGLPRRIAVVSAPAVAALLRPLGYAILPNDRPGDGLGASVAIGARHAAGCGGLLVMLGDMPRVSAGHLHRLLATDAPVAASTAGGGAPMPPARFAASLLPRLTTLSGRDGARALLAGAGLVDADPRELADVDTPAALAACSSFAGEAAMSTRRDKAGTPDPGR